MLSLGGPKIYDMPIVQAIFEGNVIQLSELITQREEVNAIVSICTIIILVCYYNNLLYIGSRQTNSNACSCLLWGC